MWEGDSVLYEHFILPLLSTTTWDGISTQGLAYIPSLTASRAGHCLVLTYTVYVYLSRSYSLWNVTDYCIMLHYQTTKNKLWTIVCITYYQSDNISAWWSGVAFYRKIPVGHLRRDEFRVGSYRKIQWHLSLASSFTMALGGGPWS